MILMNLEEKFREGLVISVDKPYGWTSSDVVRKVKGILRYNYGLKKIKVGHAGTLDPLATGVLVICIGRATKRAEEMQAEEKEYIADIRFGATTPCFDLEKPIDATYPYEHINIEKIEKAIEKFLGEIDQIPPVFSAKMIDGTRAYELARRGEEVQMRSAKITIREIEIVKFSNPDLVLRIVCSKGTYIRSIARDLGEELESGAHLSNLRRTRSGNFIADKSLNITELENYLKNFETK